MQAETFAPVTTVAGRTGDVVLAQSDVSGLTAALAATDFKFGPWVWVNGAIPATDLNSAHAYNNAFSVSGFVPGRPGSGGDERLLWGPAGSANPSVVTYALLVNGLASLTTTVWALNSADGTTRTLAADYSTDGGSNWANISSVSFAGGGTGAVTPFTHNFGSPLNGTVLIRFTLTNPNGPGVGISWIEIDAHATLASLMTNGEYLSTVGGSMRGEIRMNGQQLTMAGGAITSGWLQLLGDGGYAALEFEHTIENHSAGNNVFNMCNRNNAGYSAIAIRDLNRNEKTAWGYGNPGGETVSQSQGFIECSDATNNGTAPRFVFFHSTDYGTPGTTPYNKHQRHAYEQDGRIRWFKRMTSVGGDVDTIMEITATDDIRLGLNGAKIGAFGATPAARQTVTGSRGGNAALASLITALATLGLVTDSSS